MTNFFSKIRARGLKWLLWRIKWELINPRAGNLAEFIYLIRRIYLKSSKLLKPGKTEGTPGVYAVYDLLVAPITYNLAEFLIYAELKAKANGFSKFTLVIVNQLKKEYSFEYDSIVNHEQKEWRVQNLLIPLALNYSGCENVLVCTNFASLHGITRDGLILPEIYSEAAPAYYNQREFLSLTKTQTLGVGFKASKRAIDFIEQLCKEKSIKNLITITLRDYGYDLGRNSNVEQWGYFCTWLISEGYSVVVVPDAEQPFRSYSNFPQGVLQNEFCWNLSLRLALYEKALINFGMPNGPMGLAMSSKFANVVIMKYKLGYSEIFKSKAHLARPLYCKDNHYFSSETDDLPNLQRIFIATIAELKNSPNDFLSNKC
jgi:hypothetical protein